MKFDKDVDKDVPQSFRRNERAVVSTVGDMIAELQQLPHGMPFGDEWGDPCKVAVTNVNGVRLVASVRNADD